ncbi:MAG TPA: polysaccharide deacetylase family protein [Gemmatimonadales bacterium]|nr:polysaccharide deacetylase family protein [Gemmatimonadales bacterium]
MRAVLKGVVEAVLARGGPATLARVGRRGGTLVLAYHNIVPDGTTPLGDRSLHLPLSRFAAQLDLLQRWTEVVPLEQLDLPAPDGRPRAVITFDDAYRGAVTLAVDALAARRLPATIFVTPGLLGDRAFWWDRLAGETGLPPDVREHALHDLRGEGDLVVQWAAGRGMALADVPPAARSATEAELEQALQRHPGLTVAVHTWTHPNLALLPPERVESELAQSHRWLADRFGARARPWVSYPYGAYSDAVERTAAKLGMTGAFRIEGGWTRPGADAPHRRARFNVPSGLSDDGFALRLAGLIPR